MRIDCPKWDTVSHKDFRIEILLLKPNGRSDFFFRERSSCRCDDQFVLHVIPAVNDRDDLSDKPFNRMINSKNIRIQFFPVRRDDAFQITVINRILQIRVFRMPGSGGAVDDDGHIFSPHINPPSGFDGLLTASRNSL